PSEKGRFTRWQSTEFDARGLPRRIRDFSGLDMAIDYADRGAIGAAIIKRDGQSYGFQFNRDKDGRVQEVKSSEGNRRYSYGSDGQLAKIEVEAGGQRSIAEWKSGLLQKLRQFDGGEYSLAYHDKELARLPKEITTPNRLTLSYKYDGSNR